MTGSTGEIGDVPTKNEQKWRASGRLGKMLVLISGIFRDRMAAGWPDEQEG